MLGLIGQVFIMILIGLYMVDNPMLTMPQAGCELDYFLQLKLFRVY